MYAAIDAGSNTQRLLIGTVARNNVVVPHAYFRRISRLAGNMSAEKGLAQDAMSRTLAVFHEFAEYCQQHNVSRIEAVGTAAFRKAINGHDFAEKVRVETGIPLKIISGEDEARLAAAGVLSAINSSVDRVLIVDIGGGSTEFILCIDGQAVWFASCALGVVSLTEVHTDTRYRQREIMETVKDVYRDIVDACSRHKIKSTDLSLVGTAGTVTTIAALDMKMAEYDWRRVNNYLLKDSRIESWYQDLCRLNIAEREALPGMEAGRGDLILSGMEILLSLMQTLKINSLITSDFGLLEGILLSHKNDRTGRSFD